MSDDRLRYEQLYTDVLKKEEESVTEEMKDTIKKNHKKGE